MVPGHDNAFGVAVEGSEGSDVQHGILKATESVLPIVTASYNIRRTTRSSFITFARTVHFVPKDWYRSICH